jgi:hypothetical protein
MKTPAKSGGSQVDTQAGTDCQGSTDGYCRRSRHYVVISDEFRLADFLEIPSLDLEGLVVLARIEVYEILFGSEGTGFANVCQGTNGHNICGVRQDLG